MWASSGGRRVVSISDDFAEACAEYLGIPRAQVLLLAGRMTPADFYDDRDVYEQEVERAMQYIGSDPEWCHVITTELRQVSVDSRFALVKLYEAA